MLVYVYWFLVMCHCLRTTNGSKLRVLVCLEITTLSAPKTINNCESQECFVFMIYVLCSCIGQ